MNGDTITDGNFSTNVAAGLIKLHSKDHEEILNVIDQLRSQGISKYVNLPQLIVCGDQSSGKSSVLEAISGLGFPQKENLCTRFATELILRRAPQESLTVSINPDDDCSVDEKARLRGFQPRKLALEHVSEIIRDAENFMGIGRDGRQFSKDVLRIQLQGPEQPHLTLVDLPGLYHAHDESQDEEGVGFVESLVSSYMHNKRSVILAIISAKSDIALQKVTTLTRKVDPHGARTMGIITKPDTLPKGSDMEESFYDLALNKRMPFDLGWHVLKNRSFEERNMTLTERRDSESKFLSTGKWATLPLHLVGIRPLRPRLSRVLRDHIISQLPGLIEETQKLLAESRDNLERLGEARSTLTDQRRYLFQSSERFTSLVSSAKNGVYNDPYFGDAMSNDGYERRLRAVVQNRLSDFAEEMWLKGKAQIIVDDGREDLTENEIHRSRFVEEVRQRMRRSRGCELPGTFNPLIVGDLFFIQSKPWAIITAECIKDLLSDLRKAIIPLLKETVDEKSAEGILRHIINPTIDTMEQSLRKSTADLLSPQQRGHPITYNHYFIECVSKSREEHLFKSIKKKLKQFFKREVNDFGTFNQRLDLNLNRLATSLAAQTEADLEQFASSEAIDCMMAYYKVARKKFVDDFSILAVEKCLLDSLPTMFCSRTVNFLSDDVVKDIAAEDETSQLERQRLGEKITILQESLDELHRLDRHNLMVNAEPDQQSFPEHLDSDLERENRKHKGGSNSENGSGIENDAPVSEVPEVFPPPDRDIEIEIEIERERVAQDLREPGEVEEVQEVPVRNKNKKKHSIFAQWEEERRQRA